MKGNFMTAIPHPITGVKLNPIEIERRSLSFKEAVTAWLLRLGGHKYNHVAQYLGTNTLRLGEVFRGETHVGSEEVARSMMK